MLIFHHFYFFTLAYLLQFLFFLLLFIFHNFLFLFTFAYFFNFFLLFFIFRSFSFFHFFWVCQFWVCSTCITIHFLQISRFSEILEKNFDRFRKFLKLVMNFNCLHLCQLNSSFHNYIYIIFGNYFLIIRTTNY